MRRVLLTDEIDLVLDDLTSAMGDHFQVYSCGSGKGLTQVIEDFRPDLMVLDLSMPGYDPMDVLRSIQNRNILVIATCLGITDYLVQLLDQLGVRWLITKPLQSSTVAARLLELELQLDDPPDRNIRSAVYDLLIQTGIPLSRPAFHPLTEAILFAVQNPDCSMVEDLYPQVAKACNTTTASVEITMRRGIEQAFRFRNRYIWKRLFDNTALAKCPSNSAYIKQLAHTIRKQLHLHTY